MRLIDADALAKELMHEGLCYQYNRVINAPTVDAIPVKWIEHYGRENWFDFGTQYNAVTEMLKAWAERNDS